ncbi:MAG: carbamoyl-phosphate synthase large subunit [SAR324 cluster bacterium]|nr:carbamoyl-phosphate synthase large subunit [SAR324 cluster bacterium]
MPKRTDIDSILIIGSGPIVIGQACEFDYSGTQACKALKEEGYRVILINSNPATIMTDPDLVDATYIEPITVDALEAIIQQEKPDAILPTMGGQTALNMAMELNAAGILEKYHVELIGANAAAIHKAENREAFRKAMDKLNIRMPKSRIVHTMEEARLVIKEIGLPLIIRPSFTLGGTGSGVASTMEEFEKIANQGLTASPTSEILVEESILGWKEYELEVMRDMKDNVVIICSIENLDPMGIHTGDSITVAPAQTLTDVEYQHMRDLSLEVIREIGVDTGGSNIQFAVNPENGEIIIIEMNPRVSRSSALASKATGFAIAKIAAKLAIGYTLDEIPNDITKKTPACFEPTIDYVVTKIPRFAFEKFPFSDTRLTTQMKSVGEVMAIGRTFKESFHKALRSLEVGSDGLEEQDYGKRSAQEIDEFLKDRLSNPSSERIWYLADAMRQGWSDQKLFQYSKIDPWFLGQIRTLIDLEKIISTQQLAELNADDLRYWKQLGFSDARMSKLLGCSEAALTEKRKALKIIPVFKLVDTCAAEFPSETPYFYSTYEEENESIPSPKKKIVILGSGPNRIGQGIEFDYCCVHAAFAVKEKGYESIMINCNPETVSTDYDTSDRLYFEPITFEDVMHIVELEKPIGVIVQLGGQTPLKLARQLKEAGVPLLGTSFESIDRAEDRQLFTELLDKLELQQPPNGTAFSLTEAEEIARKIGYPILVRPSYVLGGRAMMIVYSEDDLDDFFHEAVKVSPDHPVLIDKFLLNATEIDVDFLSDGKRVELGGIMEHIEQAGIHSGDSACSLPPHSLSPLLLQKIEEQGQSLGRELNVIGLMNIQFAVKDGEIYVIEVNPRASRTVPFVSKAIRHPLAKYATYLMMGESFETLNFKYRPPKTCAVKETVFPFSKFAGTDTELGPEMKSTGEVMGWGDTFEEAYFKSQLAVYHNIPTNGYVFIGVLDKDKEKMIPLAKKLESMGYAILATPGTFEILKEGSVSNLRITSMDRAQEQNIYQYLIGEELAFVINTTKPRKRFVDHTHLRRMTLLYNLPYFTTVEGAENFVRSMSSQNGIQNLSYRAIQT